jgi:hypothetical protein
MIIPSAISKHGTEADKARLVGRIPVPHQHKRKRKVPAPNPAPAQQRGLNAAPPQQRRFLNPAPPQQRGSNPAPTQQRLNPAPAQVAVLGDRRPTSEGCGCCAIQGCAHATSTTINHSHHCFKKGCPYFVHNLCA